MLGLVIVRVILLNNRQHITPNCVENINYNSSFDWLIFEAESGSFVLLFALYCLHYCLVCIILLLCFLILHHFEILQSDLVYDILCLTRSMLAIPLIQYAINSRMVLSALIYWGGATVLKFIPGVKLLSYTYTLIHLEIPFKMISAQSNLYFLSRMYLKS